jgi:hypothetical protein
VAFEAVLPDEGQSCPRSVIRLCLFARLLRGRRLPALNSQQCKERECRQPHDTRKPDADPSYDHPYLSSHFWIALLVVSSRYASYSPAKQTISPGSFRFPIRPLLPGRERPVYGALCANRPRGRESKGKIPQKTEGPCFNTRRAGNSREDIECCKQMRKKTPLHSLGKENRDVATEFPRLDGSAVDGCLRR